MSVHADKIESVLRRAIQEVLSKGLHDPRVRGMISVTRLRLSGDFADVTVFVSIHPVEHAELSMHGLRAATAHVRRQVAGRVRLRRMPKLTFKIDESIKKESEILQALRDDESALRKLTGRDPKVEPPVEEDSP